MITCSACFGDFDEDDVVWADKQGHLTMSGMPYCAGCLPNEPNYDEPIMTRDEADTYFRDKGYII